MKKLFVLFLFMSISSLLYLGCDKDDDNPVDTGNGNGNEQLTVNGSGFSNTKINASAGVSFYAIKENLTSIVIMSPAGSDTTAIVIATPGKTTGTFQWNVTDNTTILSQYRGDSLVNMFIGNPGGSTTINSYPNVGSYMSGSLNGTLTGIYGGSITMSGNFKALRAADVDSIGESPVVRARHIMSSK